MQDYEKLGAFYLGRRWDPAAGRLTDDLVLYDSPDLTTHAVIIGMTGSGKTGLGISLLEEAAIDKVPVIAITDNALSPLARASRICFQIEERASTPFRMLVAPICLAQALVVAVGEQLG